MNQLVEFLILTPGLADVLAAEHIDDGYGYCEMCAYGARRGYFRMPCDIRRLADAAKELEGRRPG